jgi:predicted Rossmann-fold nucleotide-binding protein
MKVVVCGGRDFRERAFAFAELSRLHDLYGFTEVIQGGAKGADSLAYWWAKNKEIPVKTVNAQWEIHGKSAGVIRNFVMADMKPDLVIAFPGGRGTKDMVRIARKRGIKVIEVVL